MKLFFLIILVIFAPILVSSNGNCRYWEFIQFKYNYNMTYPNASVEYHRCKIFTANLEMIERHNHLFRAGKYSFSLAVNKFAHHTNEEFIAAHTGLLPKPNNSTTIATLEPILLENHQRRKRSTASWTVPSTFQPENLDLRTTAIPVRDQGDCGSCWVFAATGILEYYYLTKKNWTYDLAEQQFVDCVTGDSAGCDGGFPSDALNYARSAGIDFESVYPYKAVNQTCSYKSTTVATNGVAAKNTPKWYTFPSSELALAYATYTYGWISVCINSDALQFYNSGIARLEQCQTKINHAVIVVGYGTDPSGIPYWLIRNSWGSDWGEAGYFRLERNKNACNIMINDTFYRNYVA